jgi:predicted O-methyltransferase YrrM
VARPRRGPDARVETIEGDPSHAAVAEGNFAAEGLAGQISILGGRAAATMAKLKGPYDLIYFDGNPDEAIEDLDQFERLIRQGGTLLSANLFLGVFAPDIPGLEQTAEYRRRITNGDRWITAWLHSGSKAISVRR